MEAVKDDDNNHVSVNDVDDKAVAAKYIILSITLSSYYTTVDMRLN